MENKKRYGIRKILETTLWLTICAGTVVLLVAAMRKKDAQHCKGISIDIKGVSNNFFVDKGDILNSITTIANGSPVGKSTGSFNLKLMEMELRKNTWIKTAELFFDNNEILHVNVNEREPIARIFTSAGSTFYIDGDISVLPLSEKFSALLPVFTHFPSDRDFLTTEDSSLLKDIRTISLAIQKDSFRMAMIDQVDITPQRSFEMMPKIGNQLIIFGDASDAEEKFGKLQLFYKKVMTKAGWNTYSIINLQYKNQVVAKRKGADDVKADSLRTLQLMQIIAFNAEKQATDTLQTILPENEHNNTDSIMIQQSVQREDIPEQAGNGTSNTKEKPTLNEQPVLNSDNPAEVKNAATQDPMPLQKPGSTRPLKPVHKPKATMQKKNDY